MSSDSLAMYSSWAGWEGALGRGEMERDRDQQRFSPLVPEPHVRLHSLTRRPSLLPGSSRLGTTVLLGGWVALVWAVN